jgi:hypothetical protein
VVVAVVRVNGMGHISRNDETTMNGSEVVFLSVALLSGLEDAFSGLYCHVAISTLSRLRAYFLMIEQHDHVDLRVVTLFSWDLAMFNEGIERGKTAEKIVKSGRGDEFFMDSSEVGRVNITEIQFEVHNAVTGNSNIVSHHVGQSRVVILLNVEGVLRNGIDATLEKLIYELSSNEGFEVVLFVDFESFSFLVQMNAERRKHHKWPFGVPVFTYQLVSFVDNYLSCQSKISVKPSAPQTSSIAHDVELLVSMHWVDRFRSDLENRGVGMTTNDLEVRNRLSSHFLSCKESNDSRAITSEVVSLSSFNIPSINFFKLSESI